MCIKKRFSATGFPLEGFQVTLRIPRMNASPGLSAPLQSAEMRPNEVPKAVAALKKGKVKQVEIGGKEFWTAEIKENSPAGKMHTFTFTTSMANYTLQFALLSFDAKLAEKLRRSIESISFFEPIQAKVIAGDNARLFPVRQANNAAETCFGPPHIRKAA